MVLVVLVCAIADMVMVTVCKNLPNDVLAIDWPVVIFPMVKMLLLWGLPCPHGCRKSLTQLSMLWTQPEHKQLVARSRNCPKTVCPTN